MGKIGEYTKTDGTIVTCLRGPAFKYEPAFNPNWWQRILGRKQTTARMRRDCAYCQGTYYESVGIERDQK